MAQEEEIDRLVYSAAKGALARVGPGNDLWGISLLADYMYFAFAALGDAGLAEDTMTGAYEGPWADRILAAFVELGAFELVPGEQRCYRMVEEYWSCESQ